jgi:hypothetical protein
VSDAASVGQSPAPRRDPEQAKRHTLAQLRQMTWEATQWLSYDEVREFVESVLREVESDEP